MSKLDRKTIYGEKMLIKLKVLITYCERSDRIHILHYRMNIGSKDIMDRPTSISFYVHIQLQLMYILDLNISLLVIGGWDYGTGHRGLWSLGAVATSVVRQ